MLAVVQKIVQCAVVLYLVIHGLPVVSATELRGLASAVLAQFSRRPRRSAARIARHRVSTRPEPAGEVTARRDVRRLRIANQCDADDGGLASIGKEWT
jgi:hypothetical protein